MIALGKKVRLEELEEQEEAALQNKKMLLF